MNENQPTVEFTALPTKEFDWLKPQNQQIIDAPTFETRIPKSEDDFPTAVIRYEIIAPLHSNFDILNNGLQKDQPQEDEEDHRLAKMIGLVLIGMSIATTMFLLGMNKALDILFG